MYAREDNKLGSKPSRHQSPSPSVPGSITPRQRTHPSPSPSTTTALNPREISIVSQTIVEDELSKIERQVVSLTILKGKRGKLEAIMEGKREVPRELKTERSLPGLGPNYRFSPQLRLEMGKLNKQHDHEFVDLCLRDLTEKVLPDAIQDLGDSIVSSRRRITRKVGSEDELEAVIRFNKGCISLLEQGEQLLAVRRPQQKKKPWVDDRRHSKRPRQDRPYKPVN